MQNAVFDHFFICMEAEVRAAALAGTLDEGITSLGCKSAAIPHREVVHTDEGSGTRAPPMHVWRGKKGRGGDFQRFARCLPFLVGMQCFPIPLMCVLKS